MAAAVSSAMTAGSSSSISSRSPLMKTKNNNKTKRNNYRVVFFSASATTTYSDPYQTLSVNRGASESEVKKAFRRLALQYHPDVCRGDNCTINFHQINEAYDMVMSNFRGETKEEEAVEASYYDPDEGFRGTDNDSEWDLWEEWMGWEGAGIRDYSSHVNPYI